MWLNMHVCTVYILVVLKILALLSTSYQALISID